MSDPKVEAVRNLILNYRRTRRTQSTPYPKAIKSKVLQLLSRGRSIPQLSKQIGISNVLIYQWKKEVEQKNKNIDDDLFIEIPVDSLYATPADRSGGVIEVRRDDLSASIRIDCSIETIDKILKDFIGGTFAC